MNMRAWFALPGLLLGSASVTAGSIDSLPTMGSWLETTNEEMVEVCNKSIQHVHLCQNFLDHALLFGFSDIREYLHFAHTIDHSAYSGEPLAGLKPLRNEPVFQQAADYIRHGEPLPERLEEQLEALYSSRRQQEARALNVAEHELYEKIESYFRFQRFLDSQHGPDLAEFIALSDDGRPPADEVITVTGRQIGSWGTGASFITAVSMAIQQAGIYHEGPTFLSVRLEVSDSTVSKYHMFRYREGTGARKLGGWVECPECPPLEAIGID